MTAAYKLIYEIDTLVESAIRSAFDYSDCIENEDDIYLVSKDTVKMFSGMLFKECVKRLYILSGRPLLHSETTISSDNLNIGLEFNGSFPDITFKPDIYRILFFTPVDFEFYNLCDPLYMSGHTRSGFIARRLSSWQRSLYMHFLWEYIFTSTGILEHVKHI